MKEAEKILTLRPQGKNGVNIDNKKHDTVKNYLIKTIKKEGTITYQDLSDQAIADLSPTFDGKVVWYLASSSTLRRGE